jgi:5,10-methylenetetrahydrofolate reductase
MASPDSVGVMNIGTSAEASWQLAVARCPKQMLHGPCAGVGDDHGCEVPSVGSCSFLEALDAWPYPSPERTRTPLRDAVRHAVPAGLPASADPAAAPVEQGRVPAAARAAESFRAVAARRPMVVADLPAAPLSADALRASADVLAPAADACLLGDHGGARVQFPPSYRARLLTERGVAVWAGVTCRDRNRVALEGEIAACVDAGVTAVHCVTGDHPALGHRADASAVFDLDCIGVADLARGRGPLVSAAHAPAAPPRQHRLSRLLAKIDAGVEVVFVDHCGGPDQVGDAAAELRDAGFGGLVLACVPVVTSATTAAVVASFAAGRLPVGYLERVLDAADPREAGVRAGADLAERMLALPGIDGVNLSGGAEPGHELAAAHAAADISRRVLGATRDVGTARDVGAVRLRVTR